MKKSIIIKLIVLAVIGLLVWYVFFPPVIEKGDIDHATVTISDSLSYQRSDIEVAIQVVKNSFINYPAKLNRIWYEESKSDELSIPYKSEYKSNSVIVILTDFKTYRGDYVAEKGFESNKEYKNYKWVLLKENGIWIIKNFGLT